MKKGNTVSSRIAARLSFLVVGLMGLRLFSGEAFATDYAPCDIVNDIPRVECEALVDFYYSTSGDGWTKGFSGDIVANKPWLTGSLACNWRGITCNTSPEYIRAISLSTNNLSGVLNSSLSNLSGMIAFVIDQNNIKGELPKEYSNWENMDVFRVHVNKLSGNIPKEYSSWKKIRSFALQNNQFEGELPKEFGEMWSGGILVLFRVQGNKLTGMIPDSYCNWTNLNHFSVSYNNLVGTLPDQCFQSFKNLIALELGDNKLDLSKMDFDAIPLTFPSLILLNIANSKVTGSFGSGWENFTGMKYLQISNNNISGKIPDYFINYPFEYNTSPGNYGIGYPLSLKNNCLDTQSVQEPLLSFINQWAEPDWQTTQTACQVIIPPVPTPAPSYGGGGGGGIALKKDDCPNDDFSPSYYDGTCGDTPTNDDVGTGLALSNNEKSILSDNTKPIDEKPASQTDNASIVPTTNEIQSAYDWAFSHNITTLAPIETSHPTGTVIRGHLAKMVVNYALNVLGRTLPKKVPTHCHRKDGTNARESQEIKDYAVKACSLGLMGIDMEYFQPLLVVTRAQFGTILSRLLYETTYNGGTPYYAKHLQALKENGIMTQIDNPEQRKELRQRVRLMLMRSSKK